MSQIQRPRRIASWLIAVAALAFIFAPRKCEAQFFGYGGYGFPGYGFYGGYGMYGGYGLGFPGMGFGYGLGFPGMGYGAGIVPGYGYGYGYPFGLGYPGFAYTGSLLSNPYTNPLFGVGLTPLGVNSYFTEMNMLGRGQARAGARQGAPVIRQGR